MKEKKFSGLRLFILKFFLISLFVFGYIYSQDEFSNKIPLVAVNELDNGEIRGGNLINLTLTTKPGDGNIFIDLGSVKEVDTQISIINSQEIACTLFNLNCNQYDFYYKFEGDSFILKGPSASLAISILVAKTLQKEKIDPKITMTGALNSGGLIGNVGGIDEKIKVAQRNELEKILVPVFGDFNKEEFINTQDIEIIQVFDLIESYNLISTNNYTLKQDVLNNESYNVLMKDLAEQMCSRSEEIYSQINTLIINNESIINPYLEQRENSINFSKNSFNTLNYYSAGSFCYNANINSRIALELQKNHSFNEINTLLKELEKEIQLKKVILNTREYRTSIKTLNDFYVYILLQDRIQEALEFAKQENPEQLRQQISQLNLNNLTQEEEEFLRVQKIYSYAYAKERYYTVSLWENLILNEGREIDFNEKTIESACNLITREILMKNELLKEYSVNIFNRDIEKQREYAVIQEYLCIYNGLKLDGRINTVLNSVGLQNNQSEDFTAKILELAKSRLTYDTEGHFPLIPYIYYEYATQLLEQGDKNSAMLYSNFALSYQELNRLLKKEEIQIKSLKQVLNESYKSLIFVFSLLILISYIGIEEKKKHTTKKIKIDTNSKPAKLEKKHKIHENVEEKKVEEKVEKTKEIDKKKTKEK